MPTGPMPAGPRWCRTGSSWVQCTYHVCAALFWACVRLPNELATSYLEEEDSHWILFVPTSSSATAAMGIWMDRPSVAWGKYVCKYMKVCMRAPLCVDAQKFCMRTHLCVYAYQILHACMPLCVCVCVCKRICACVSEL